MVREAVMIDRATWDIMLEDVDGDTQAYLQNELDQWQDCGTCKWISVRLEGGLGPLDSESNPCPMDDNLAIDVDGGN